MALNKVMVIGNLGADPELRATNSGESVCSFRLAATEKWKSKGGDEQEHTEWFKCSLWGKSGEALAKHATKGSSLYVEGSLRTRKYQDDTGADRYATELRVDKWQFVGSKPNGDRNDAPVDKSVQRSRQQDVFDDDLPF